MREFVTAFAKLVPTQREALLLAVLEGLPYEVIAAHTGVSVGTVKSRISRARDTLERLLLEGDVKPRRPATGADAAAERRPSRDADDEPAAETLAPLSSVCVKVWYRSWIVSRGEINGSGGIPRNGLHSRDSTSWPMTTSRALTGPAETARQRAKGVDRASIRHVAAEAAACDVRRDRQRAAARAICST